MANGINIGNLTVDSFKVGSSDCKIYLGDTLLYPLSYKLVAQHSDLTEYKVACNASSVLSSAETKADSASASTRNVTIGDCVTELGAYTFNSFANLTGVTLPSGLTTIGEYAFNSTHGITSITLPNSVVTIGDSAFRHMHGLKELNIPSGVTTIPNWCFNDCTALSSFTIPSNITTINTNAFSYCTALKEVHFQSTTPPTIGGNYPFNGSTNLEKIYIPSCDNYDAYAAALPNYTDLLYAEDGTSCYTPPMNYKIYRRLKNGVTAETACNSTSALTSGDVRSNYTIQTLTSSTSGLCEVIVGDCVTSISAKTFTGMTQLTSITFSNSVKTIGATACCVSTSTASSNKLHDINLGKVETIGNDAFRYCGGNYATNQPKIKFPNTLTAIGNRAFMGGKYNELTFENGGRCSIGASAFTNSTSYSTITISTNSISELGAYSFAYFSGLTSVSLSGVTVLYSGGRQFANCKDLTDLEIRGTDLIVPPYFVGGGDASTTAITLGGISEISNAYGLNQGNYQASVRSLTMLDTTPPKIGSSSISDYNPTVIYVPSSAVDTYKTDSGWKTYASKIQAIPT